MVKYPPSLDATFRALADPTRRGIVERLAQGETSVSELAAPFQSSLPAVFQHLRVLEEAGLVSGTKRGRVRYCRLHADRLSEATSWIEDRRRIWERRLDNLATHLEEPAGNGS